jgi:hypothetical protein
MKKSVNSTDYIWRTIVMPFLLISILVACSSAPSLTPSPTETPTAVPTFTPTPIPTPIRLGKYELLSPEDMRYDLDELFHRIETTHPNPYTKRPKSEVDLDRQKIHDEIDNPMTMFDFYNKIAPLVVSLGDFHTQVILPSDIFGGSPSKEKFLPFEVQFTGERGFAAIDFTGNSDIPPGTELLTINGTAIAIVQSELLLHNLRYYPFPVGFWILNGSLPEYQVEMLRPGETTPIMLTIPSLTAAEFDQNAVPAESKPWEPVAYSKVTNEPTGILTVNTFGEIGPLLTPIFAQIRADGVLHLILDIRLNGGGKYDVVDSLMDFLTDKPYKHCSKSYEAPFKGYGAGAPREVACELIQPFNAAERFQGKLYLLIGPQTNSAAITFATILQDYDLATLIGEETYDVASYCANIVLEGTPLPRTGLMYTLSKTCYVRPSGVLDDNPVIPDINVETTIEDQIAGRDPVLKYTLDMIRSGQTP